MLPYTSSINFRTISDFLQKALSLKQNLQCRRRLNRLKLGKKIGYGYALTLGIAIIGISIGLVIGDHYQYKAKLEKDDAAGELNLANRLKISMLLMSVEQKDSILTLQDPTQWEQEHNRFLAEKDNLQKIWKEFESSQGTVRDDIKELDGEEKIIKELMENYDILTQDLQRLEAIFQKIHSQLSAQQRQILQAEAMELHNQFLLGDASRLVKQLYLFSEHAEEETEAAILDLMVAERIRLQIIIGSLVASIIVASALVVWVSRAITRPILSTSAVAQQVISSSDFRLQAPVISDDEVGHLTISLNRLITTVHQLLQEQQEKNVSLEKALHEIRSTQAMLVQSEKMSSLGQMVAGVAHEINNPVSFIHGNLFHLQQYLIDLLQALNLYQQQPTPLPKSVQEELDGLDLDYLAEDTQKILSSMQIGTERIAEIVRSLRNFSRLDEAEVKAADINEGIDNTLMILSHRMKASATAPEIQVHKSYADFPPVQCYAGQLNQVFMNILSNAIDAFEEMNQNRSYQEIKENPNILHITTELISGSQVSIQIQDNGKGIPKSVLDKIFDPFFTTKEVGKGTGLGLAISYQVIVDKHGGRLYCDSKPGQGTTFFIQIPLIHPAFKFTSSTLI